MKVTRSVIGKTKKECLVELKQAERLGWKVVRKEPAKMNLSTGVEYWCSVETTDDRLIEEYHKYDMERI